MKLSKLHNRIRYAFKKLDYSVHSKGAIWSMLSSEGWSIGQFDKAFDELVRAGYLGKTELFWVRIKPKR